jgi:hypothetical protein
MKMFRIGLGSALALMASQAQALDFQLASHVGDAWSYTLTYVDYENMSDVYSGIPPTITLSGLYGVTGVTGPTSTDFGPFIEASQLQWFGTVLDGGTKVVFTIPTGTGTGNFSDERHVFGFTLIAPDTMEGDVDVVTTGFFYEGPIDEIDHESRDISKVIRGPVGPAVPEPAIWAMMIGGFALAGGALRRHRASVQFA